MNIPQQAIEAVKLRWTWKPLHWKSLPSDEELAAILGAARPHIEAELRAKIVEEIREFADGFTNPDLRASAHLAATQIAEGEHA